MRRVLSPCVFQTVLLNCAISDFVSARVFGVLCSGHCPGSNGLVRKPLPVQILRQYPSDWTLNEDFVTELFVGPATPIVPLICGDLLVLYRELDGDPPEKDPLIAPRVLKANLLLVSAYSADIKVDKLKAGMNDEGVALIVDFSIACPLISREGLRYLDRDSSVPGEAGIVMWLSTDLRIATSPQLADGSVTPPSD